MPLLLITPSTLDKQFLHDTEGFICDTEGSFIHLKPRNTKRRQQCHHDLSSGSVNPVPPFVPVILACRLSPLFCNLETSPPPFPLFRVGSGRWFGSFQHHKRGGEVPQKTGPRMTGTEGGNFFLTAASFPPASRGAAERIVPFPYGVWGGGGKYFFLSFFRRQTVRTSFQQQQVFFGT